MIQTYLLAIISSPYYHTIFEGSSIQITTAGMGHLGAALGSQDFKKKYISDKVSKWIEVIEKLSEIAESQPHAAYSVYVHGYQHKFNYFLRTLDDIGEELRPLDEVITSKLIPSIVGSQLSEVERSLVSLPVRLGGMGIESPSSIASDEYSRSKQMTGPLAAIIALQGISLPDVNEVDQIRRVTFRQKSDALKQKSVIFNRLESKEHPAGQAPFHSKNMVLH